MPLHEQSPGSTEFVWVKPKNGKFQIQEGENTKEYSAISGSLSLVRIEDDPGNPTNKVMPYKAFIMHVRDEDRVYHIKMNLDRNFTFSVARALGDISPNEEIILKTSQGDDPTITFCNIYKKGPTDEEGRFSVKPETVTLPTDKAERLEAVTKIIMDHPAYKEKVEKE